jgi:hypothetical protein
MELYKDTGLVGSIGTSGVEFGISSSNDLVLTQNTTTQRNLLFRDSFFGPFGADNNAIDLGRSVGRFKDLYLSGGVYLGGTGSANHLDDYEEGTFTPVLSGYTSVAGTMSGKYTKIGNMVFCEVVMVITALTYSGNSRITGWPYAPSDTINNHSGHGTIANGTALNVDPHLYSMGFYAQTGNLYLYNKNSGGALSGNNYQVGTLGIKVAYRTAS